MKSLILQIDSAINSGEIVFKDKGDVLLEDRLFSNDEIKQSWISNGIKLAFWNIREYLKNKVYSREDSTNSVENSDIFLDLVELVFKYGDLHNKAKLEDKVNAKHLYVRYFATVYKNRWIEEKLPSYLSGVSTPYYIYTKGSNLKETTINSAMKTSLKAPEEISEDYFFETLFNSNEYAGEQRDEFDIATFFYKEPELFLRFFELAPLLAFHSFWGITTQDYYIFKCFQTEEGGINPKALREALKSIIIKEIQRLQSYGYEIDSKWFNHYVQRSKVVQKIVNPRVAFEEFKHEVTGLSDSGVEKIEQIFFEFGKNGIRDLSEN